MDPKIISSLSHLQYALSPNCNLHSSPHSAGEVIHTFNKAYITIQVSDSDWQSSEAFHRSTTVNKIFLFTYNRYRKMFRFACILAVLSCVSAFMPASVARSSSSISMMAAEGMSRSLPFCKKPKNLDGMIVST